MNPNAIAALLDLWAEEKGIKIDYVIEKKE